MDESTDDEPTTITTITTTTTSKQHTKVTGKDKLTPPPPSATGKDTKDSKKKAGKKKIRGRRQAQDDDYNSNDDDDDKLSALEGLLGQLGASSDRKKGGTKGTSTAGSGAGTGSGTGATSDSKSKGGGKKASGKTFTTSTTLNKTINTNVSVLYDTYFPTNNTEARTAIHSTIENLLDKKVLNTISDIDVYEWKGLSLFPDEDITAILALFEEGCGQRKVGNKSGFLVGIMKRYRSDVVERKHVATTTTTTATKSPATDDTKEPTAVKLPVNETGESPAVVTDSNKGKDSSDAADADLNKGEEEEEEEGEGDHEEEEVDESIDELDIFTGTPFPDDIILYALPVCGPYSTLMRYKYRVKLTPGTGKKGKICKQAIDIFTESRECTTMERNALKGLTDTEMVANMIGDCKLSIPGLTKVIQQTQKRKVQRRQKKKQ